MPGKGYKSPGKSYHREEIPEVGQAIVRERVCPGMVVVKRLHDVYRDRGELAFMVTKYPNPLIFFT